MHTLRMIACLGMETLRRRSQSVSHVRHQYPGASTRGMDSIQRPQPYFLQADRLSLCRAPLENTCV